MTAELSHLSPALFAFAVRMYRYALLPMHPAPHRDRTGSTESVEHGDVGEEGEHRASDGSGSGPGPRPTSSAEEARLLAALDAAINTTPPRAVAGTATGGRGSGSGSVSVVAVDLRQSPTAVSEVGSSVANGVWRAVDNDTTSSSPHAAAPQVVASTPAAVAVAAEAALSTPSHKQQSQQQGAASCTPS